MSTDRVYDERQTLSELQNKSDGRHVTCEVINIKVKSDTVELILQHPRKDLTFTLNKPDSASLDYELNRILKDKYGELSDFDRLEYDELVVVDEHDGLKLSVPTKNVLNNNRKTNQSTTSVETSYSNKNTDFTVAIVILVIAILAITAFSIPVIFVYQTGSGSPPCNAVVNVNDGEIQILKFYDDTQYLKFKSADYTTTDRISSLGSYSPDEINGEPPYDVSCVTSSGEESAVKTNINPSQ